MTIQNVKLNDRLGYIENCANDAPKGTYETAKQAARTLDAVMDSMEALFREHGFSYDKCDRTRDLHAYLYGYLFECNPDKQDELTTAEGFGEEMNGPERGRVKRQAERDRDALIALGKAFPAQA